SAIVQNLTVNADGSFTVTGTEIGTSSTGTVSLASVGHTVAAATSFTLTGKITGSAISGQLSGINKTMSGSADASTGPAQEVAGFYTATALGTTPATTYSIIGPSGQLFSVT